MQSLIQILKSGYGYERHHADGSVDRVLVTPNKYMISAARELERSSQVCQQLANALDAERILTQQLYADITMYRKTIKELEDAIRTLSNSTSDSTHSPAE